MVSRCASLTLSINWKLTLTGLLFFPLLLCLGFWQLDRAQQKRDLLQQIEKQRSLPAVHFSDLLLNQKSQEELIHRDVFVEGELYVERLFLLDNKTFAGRVGYEVVVPIGFGAEKTMLVNFGWIAAPPLRKDLPSVELPSTVKLSGRLKKPSSNPMVRQFEEKTGWPKRIQSLDIDTMSEALGESLQPWILLIDENDPLALSVNWQSVNTTPQKHIGYAVQWFTMAAVLMIALFIANTNVLTLFKNKNELL